MAKRNATEAEKVEATDLPPGVAGEAADLWADVRPATRRAMLLAALDSFARKGFHGTTTREIATRAGLSRAAVYMHFESKAEILYEIGSTGHRAALAQIDSALEGVEDPAERLRCYVLALVAWVARHHTVARVITEEVRVLPARYFDEIRPLRRGFETRLAAVLREGIEAERFQVEDRDTTLLALLSLGLDVSRWYAVRPVDPALLSERYAALALRMVAAAEPPTRGPRSRAGRGSARAA